MSQWAVPGFARERELGSGASGRVVAAVHVASGTPVAIKYLSPRYFRDPGFLAAFRDEARLLRSLASPHVVRLLDYAEAPGQGAAIVMELVDGISLHEMITRQGPAGPEAALLVLKGSLLGLAAAHALGIVHRDYKPENVLVSAQGDSKLTDFGVAVRAGHDAALGGTPLYMAPEQWDGGPATPATDIYAATVVFFECLTGLTPFSGGQAQLAAQHAAAAVPVQLIDEPLRALIARGMAKRPAYRPADAGAFISELEAAAATAYGPGWEERGRGQLAQRAAALLLLLLPGSAPVAAGAGTSTATTTLGSAAAAPHAGLSGWALIAAGAALFAAVAAGVAGAVVGVGALTAHHAGSSASPGGTVPAGAAAQPARPLLYSTATSVDLRAADGSTRTLATFSGTQGVSGGAQLASSADGSAVAWLAGGKVSELTIAGGQVRTWQCANCESIAFQGGRLLTGSYSSAGAFGLLRYPADGSAPTPLAITGLPANPFPGSLVTYSLLSSFGADEVLLGYGTGVSSKGGPQSLYRVGAQGRAVPFAAGGSQFESNSIPDGFTFSPDGTQVAFVEPSQGGVCSDTAYAVVASTATGAHTAPKMPTGMASVIAAWFGPDGTLHASMVPMPAGCATVSQTGNAIAPLITAPTDYSLQSGTWVRSGSGIISQQSAPGGWQATLYGNADSTELGASPATASLRAVITHGTTPVTIPGAESFLWAP